MAQQTKTFGQMNSGKLTLTEREAFHTSVATLSDGPVEVIIKRLYGQRTSPQNRYYHGVVLPLIAEAITDLWGEEINEDEVHALLKEKFNLRTIDTTSGTISLTGSTARLSTVEFMAYVEKCRMWAADFLSINIPDPEKVEGKEAKDSITIKTS